MDPSLVRLLWPLAETGCLSQHAGDGFGAVVDFPLCYQLEAGEVNALHHDTGL
jgi:hypothetical protein